MPKIFLSLINSSLINEHPITSSYDVSFVIYYAEQV